MFVSFPGLLIAPYFSSPREGSMILHIPCLQIPVLCLHIPVLCLHIPVLCLHIPVLCLQRAAIKERDKDKCMKCKQFKVGALIQEVVVVSGRSITVTSTLYINPILSS